MLNRKRISLLLAAITITLIAGIACGTDASGSAPASDSPSGESTTLPIVADGATDGQPTGDDPGAPAAGGLDPACVELVLGRTATGFGDITDAERTRIFAECSAGAPGSPRTRSGGLAAGFDPACVRTASGVDVTNFADLTPEQRQAVFEQCGGGARPGGLEGRPGDGERPAGGFGGGGIAGLLENECVQSAIGGGITDITQLSQEQIQQAIAQCGTELGLPEGGFGGRGFGGRQDGGPGGFGSDQGALTN